MLYPLRSRLLILFFFFFICCVALCQYIEATKFRDGARGKLARGNEGNLPTTHTSLPANLSSALTLKPFKPGTLYFLGSPLLLLHSCVFSCFLYRCGDTSFLFCTLLISLLPLLRLPHLLQQQLNNELMFDNHCFCFSHTHTNSVLPALPLLGQCLLSPYALNDFSVLPWYVHHFCLALGLNQLNLRFYDWLFSVSLCIANKAVRKHRDMLKLAIFHYFFNDLIWIIECCCLSVFSCLPSTAGGWQLYLMQYNFPLKTNMLMCSFLWSCSWHF